MIFNRKFFDKIIEKSELPDNLGPQILLNPELADIVQSALLFFESERYYLSSWCIMSNHVHVTITPLGKNTLSSILHSWKTYTAKLINRKSGKTGKVWADDAFRHLIRTYDYWTAFINYIENNPVKAGYCRIKSEWKYSSSGAGFQTSENLEFISPYSLPHVPMTIRNKLPRLEKEGCTYFVTLCLYETAIYWKERRERELSGIKI